MKEYALERLSTGQIKRRAVLNFVGSAAAVSLLGCWREESTAARSPEASVQSVADTIQTETVAMDLPICIVSPQQTEGPYFVEEGLNRPDIRSDPSDGSIKKGVPLRLVLRVAEVGAGACAPLEGAAVDVWHCDAEGVYSDVLERDSTTVGQKFLRGSQITNSEGTVEFITIYPGWYPGRAVHIHFKVRKTTHSQDYEFTSQLYFDDALSDRVYTQAPYNNRGQRNVRNQRDRIYQDSGDQLTLQLTPEEAGYTGTFNIGLQTT